MLFSFILRAFEEGMGDPADMEKMRPAEQQAPVM